MANNFLITLNENRKFVLSFGRDYNHRLPSGSEYHK